MRLSFSDLKRPPTTSNDPPPPGEPVTGVPAVVQTSDETWGGIFDGADRVLGRVIDLVTRAPTMMQAIRTERDIYQRRAKMQEHTNGGGPAPATVEHTPSADAPEPTAEDRANKAFLAGYELVKYVAEEIGTDVTVEELVRDLAPRFATGAKRAVATKAVKDWSLRSVQIKLIKVGARLVRHPRRLEFQLAPRWPWRQRLESHHAHSSAVGKKDGPQDGIQGPIALGAVSPR